MHKLFRAIFICLLLWIEAGLSFAASPYGQETRSPVGAFLNNRLPPVSVDASGGWTTVPAFPNLTFEDPTFLIRGPGTNILYVCGRQGMIWRFLNNPGVSNKTVFLNLSNRTQGYDDCGLTAMAFHPEFGRPGSTNRGFFYVWYQYSPSPINTSPNRPGASTPSYNRLSRFTVSEGSSVADPNSELVLINQYDENLWHNGGGMFFGEDGFLYLTNGDEGGGEDAYANSQKINKGLFSGVLRIDVDRNPGRSHPIRRQPQSGSPPPAGWPGSYTANYNLPNDNPFVNPEGSVLEEFYAIGFRSPFRMTYDAITKRIWLADVGDSEREEVDIVVKGGNYQWAYDEGLGSGPAGKPSTIIGTEVPPIFDYPHTSGNSCIIGGYVYRGSQYASDLGGQYIFGDNFSGRIWAMAYDGSSAPVVTYLCNMPPGLNYQGLSSFGLDERNEIYMCQMGANGRIYKLARTGANYAQPPALLSQTGVFTNAASLVAAPGLLAYDVNSPLWSDAAIKQRWIAVPNDGSPYNNAERVGFAPTGEWTFPIGTVFVKHFELAIDDTSPNLRKRLETRLLVRGTNGDFYGLTYKWRADNSDADLLTNSLSEDVVIATATGTRTQTWYYPSRQDCLICHNPNANYVLGVKTRQLNGNYTYPGTGISDNQLRTWNHLGLFNPAIDENGLTNYASLVNVTNSAASLETRVRSYLDANCSQCHRPNSGIQAYWDARFDTPLTKQGITNGAVAANLGIAGAGVVVPGDLSKSILYLRMNANGATKMPSLARNTIDTNAVVILAAWINRLGEVETSNPPGISVQPQSLAVNQGLGATFSVAATGTAPLSYQWRKNLAVIVGATGSSYSIASVQAGDVGSYSVVITNIAGSIVSLNATLAINIAPSITTQPHDQTVNQGANAIFSVGASGTVPLGYQWRKGWTAIAGGTGSSLVIFNVQPADADSYSVIVTNMAGSVSSSMANLTVNAAPFISGQPQNLNVDRGGNATFTVIATGTSPLRFQWLHNSINIAGATNSAVTISNVSSSNAGNYAVVVANVAGSIRSSNAVLTVNSPPAIIIQPISLTLKTGSDAAFGVQATGTAPLFYQWQLNGTNIDGASNSRLSLTNIQSATAGNYCVIVSNAGGSIRSSNAVLTVLSVAIPSSAGLVNWWPGDGNAMDIQGTNNGTLKNGTSFTNGIVRQAFNFDGKANLVSVGSILASITNTFTVQFWARPQASRASTVESKSGISGTTGQRFAIFPRHGASSFGTGHVGAGVSVGNNGVSVFEHTDGYLPSLLVLNLPITNWTHIALVYQNKKPSIYINGKLRRTGLASSHIVHPSGDMGGPYGFYRGALDEIGIYNRALSASEIQAIYNAGSAGLFKGLQFAGINTVEGGSIQLNLEAQTGGKIRIETSSNLLDWTSMTVVANTNGVVLFTDSASNAPVRFYRSIILP